MPASSIQAAAGSGMGDGSTSPTVKLRPLADLPPFSIASMPSTTTPVVNASLARTRSVSESGVEAVQDAGKMPALKSTLCPLTKST
jgi:hypothetical protein